MSGATQKVAANGGVRTISCTAWKFQSIPVRWGTTQRKHTTVEHLRIRTKQRTHRHTHRAHIHAHPHTYTHEHTHTLAHTYTHLRTHTHTGHRKPLHTHLPVHTQLDGPTSIFTLGETFNRREDYICIDGERGRSGSLEYFTPCGSRPATIGFGIRLHIVIGNRRAALER